MTVNYLTGNEGVTRNLVAIPNDSPVKIELLTDSGFKTITAGQSIIASGSLKTLRINDNRQMTMRMGTELSIIPHNLGCIVKLDKGEIYTEVRHDGKPFIVESIHGRAIITGTTFNIKADNMQMELVVAEGTVRFEGDIGSVNVTADHKSTLALNTMPTLPLPCDTAVLTAWTTGSEVSQEFAVKEPEIDLGSVFDRGQIDLEQIDYASWVEQKRDWFRRQFPHIFRFKAALAIEGIEVDYPELLIESGDLWRFAFPENTSTQLIGANYNSMIKLASAYNQNTKWLSDNLKISRASLASENKISTSKALDKWVSSLEETLQSSSEVSGELLTYSLHASVYLSETRTLAWLAVNDDQIALSANDRQKIAMLLEQEIKVASNCAMQFKHLFVSSHSLSVCDEDKQRKSLQSIIENIETIIEIEKVAEYETSN